MATVLTSSGTWRTHCITVDIAYKVETVQVRVHVFRDALQTQLFGLVGSNDIKRVEHFTHS